MEVETDFDDEKDLDYDPLLVDKKKVKGGRKVKKKTYTIHPLLKDEYSSIAQGIMLDSSLFSKGKIIDLSNDNPISLELTIEEQNPPLIQNILHAIKTLREGNNCQDNVSYLLNDLVFYLRTAVVPIPNTLTFELSENDEKIIYPFVDEYEKLNHHCTAVNELEKYIRLNKHFTFGCITLLISNEIAHVIIYVFDGANIFYIDPLFYDGITKKDYGCIFSDLTLKYRFGNDIKSFGLYLYYAEVGFVNKDLYLDTKKRDINETIMKYFYTTKITICDDFPFEEGTNEIVENIPVKKRKY